jgi:hypothetical protein
MGKFGEIQADFYVERTRILEALHQEENRHIILRLIGALAFRTHCPQYGYLQDAMGRSFTDIDFATYNRHIRDVMRLLSELGYQEDKMVTRLFGENRLLFHDEKNGRHIDIFIDRLDFSHVLPLQGRLEADSETLPLAELLVEKMQIFQLNEKDVIDTIMLLREHPVGGHDDETIHAGVVSRLTANDWGLWRTLTDNLAHVSERLPQYAQLEEEDRRVVRGRIEELLSRIESQPKTMRWKLRSAVGERMKWYKDVEELAGR